MKPQFGFTKLDLPVHAAVTDYHKAGTRYQKINKKVALTVTSKVGTMTCAYFFSLIALVSLPAVLTGTFHLTLFPAWLITAGLIGLVSWITQTYIQLVLLSVILVGQDVAGKASDARAAKTFEDIEVLVDRTDLHTAGGLTAIEEHLTRLEQAIARL